MYSALSAESCNAYSDNDPNTLGMIAMDAKSSGEFEREPFVSRYPPRLDINQANGGHFGGPLN